MARTTTLPITPEMQRLKQEIDTIDSHLPRYPMQVLYLIVFAASLEAFDRSLIALVLEDIRRSFDATDGQLGFLTGAFGFMAAVGVVPLGILTDRVKRVRIIALGFFPWGIAMMLQGVAPTFALFFLARMFNGALEATAGQEAPAPISLIGDYFPVEDRTRVYGIHGMGQVLGYALAPIFGGITASIFGWRGAFIFWGAFGLAGGAALSVLLPEPPRALQDARYRLQTRYLQLRLAQRRATFGEDTPGVDSPPETMTQEEARETAEQTALDTSEVTGATTGYVRTFDYRNATTRDVASVLFRNKTYLIMAILIVGNIFGVAGVSTWMPTFYRRYHGMSVTGAAVVSAFNATTALGGVYGGALLGGLLVKIGKPNLRFALIAFGQLGTAVLWGTAMVTTFTPFSIHFFFYGSICVTIPIGIGLAIRADVVHPHFRGRAQSVIGPPRIIATLLAPILFGLLSDTIGLRSAMLTLVPVYAAMGLVAILGIWTYDHDAAEMQAESVRQHTIEEAERSDALEDAKRIAAELLGHEETS
ncbi:MAG: MFS transporter [Acidobacteria bacterium]|nr:MFS transporter [Acidobacteriota bacterium]